tara:strand:+ start:131 stop:604 length:474 start_codon:yes stop_codon:yes gene_type:complete
MLDKTDLKILAILQHNSDISNQALADQVALSPSPCLRRVKQLRDAGYIKQHVAVLDADKLGLKITVFVLVGLDSHTQEVLDGFKAAIRHLPEVTQCHLITGQSADYLLKVCVTDIEHFRHFEFSHLLSIPGVANVQSCFALESIIDHTALPLAHLAG